MKIRWLILALGVLGLGSVSCRDHCSCSTPKSGCGDDWRPVQYPTRNLGRTTISQGLSGDVWLWEGDFQPMCPTGTVRAVSRELRVYAAATEADVQFTNRDGHIFIASVATALIATVSSDSTGFYQVALPAGSYSLFSVEDGLLFGKQTDSEGILEHVVVPVNETTEARFDVDYGRWF